MPRLSTDTPEHGIIDLSLVKHDPANEWSHEEEQLGQLCASLTLYGQQRDILLDARNRVVAGHGVASAARRLGWKKIGYERTHLEGSERAAYRIADNLLAALREIGLDIYNANLRGIARELGDGFDPLALGLSRAEASHLLTAQVVVSAEKNTGDGDDAVTVKVVGVKARDRFEVFERVQSALEGSEYAARMY